MSIAVALLAIVLVSSGPSDATVLRSLLTTTFITAIVQPGIQQTPPPERRVDQQTRDALLALAMGLAIFSSSLALGIAYGIRRRIDQIAGPPDPDDDD